ncbi:MAG: transglycosylase SLT domain-containing protein [Bacteroidaceae bacterium]|nr:transglycosylase SLT domain-containing protein [Bacteroidaceae bacterium]MBQ9176610.1 transglycosylase SLT domain-containing protein [Bacteroidaceae bacterium]
MKQRFFIAIIACIAFTACHEQRTKELGVFKQSTPAASLDLYDIQQGGELIVATLYGQDTYFEYYGEHFGTQYRLAEAYARSIGCQIRVDVMRDSAALLHHLANGDADIAACAIALSDSIERLFTTCGQAEITHLVDSLHPAACNVGGVAWLVRKDSPLLAQSLNQWMHDNSSRFQQLTAISISDGQGHTYTPRRRNYSAILNRAKGQISHYDHLFRRYSTTISWDWRLLAAQSYQESGFDPQAVSPMGAMGLMQLMPRTAQSVGVSPSQMFDPEANVRGGVRYLSQLLQHYSDIPNPTERTKFVLAAYNAGPGHIDDARQLARRYGRDPDRWTSNVDYFVLHLSEPRYYNDPLATHGYMRGSETYGYVSGIMNRWEEYRQLK